MLSNASKFPVTVFRQNIRRYAYDPTSKYGIPKKTFEPSLASGDAKIKTEINEIKPISIEKMRLKTGKRRLYIWDKWLLVKVGKFKSIKDVPDEIEIGTHTIDPKVEEALKGEVKERTFKLFTAGNWILWLFCFFVSGPIVYKYYFKKYFKDTDQAKTDNISNDIVQSNTKSS